MPKKEIPEGFKNMKGELPFSPVVKVGNHFHFSGVLPDLDEENKPVSKSIVEQTKQILAKMNDLLEKCGLTFNDVYSVTVMTEAEDFRKDYVGVNEVYTEALKDVEIMPRRKAFDVSTLPFGASIEIEFDAVKQD